MKILVKKNPNENPQTSSKIRTILDEERENPVSESKNPVSKNKNPKPVKLVYLIVIWS